MLGLLVNIIKRGKKLVEYEIKEHISASACLSSVAFTSKSKLDNGII
jgi:hypothetical protein